jgi:hypothetical protein
LSKVLTTILLMKRIYYLVVVGLSFFALTLPVTITRVGGVVAFSPNVARAVLPAEGGGTPTPAAGASSDSFLPTQGCVKIAIPLVNTGGKCVSNDAGSGGAIVNYLRGVLQLLGGIVGLVVMIMLVIAGVQYITSAGDPGMVKSAKNRIVNAITALVLYLMMVAILQFLIPGGIL